MKNPFCAPQLKSEVFKLLFKCTNLFVFKQRVFWGFFASVWEFD